MREGVWWLMWSKCVCRNRHIGQTLNTQRFVCVYTLAMFCLVGSVQTASSLVSQKLHTVQDHEKKQHQRHRFLHVYIGHQLKKCKECILCERPFIFVSVCLNILLCLYWTGCFETPKNWSLNTDAQFQLRKNSFFVLFLNHPTRVSWDLGAYLFLKMHLKMCLKCVVWSKMLAYRFADTSSRQIGFFWPMLSDPFLFQCCWIDRWCGEGCDI